MIARPISEKCKVNFSKKIHACFGISPFNSYFTEERIKELARWGRREFSSIHFFVPDGPSSYTLEALGYSKEEAQRKARRQGNYVTNKIHKALTSLGYHYGEAWQMIIDWKALSANQSYLQLHGYIIDHFESDTEFQSACLKASNWVLEKRTQDQITDEMLQIAVKYFLAEVPLFANSAEILNQEASVFCYHQCIPFLSEFYHGKFQIKSSENQGFVELMSPESLPLSASIKIHSEAVP